MRTPWMAEAADQIVHFNGEAAAEHTSQPYICTMTFMDQLPCEFNQLVLLFHHTIIGVGEFVQPDDPISQIRVEGRAVFIDIV